MKLPGQNPEKDHKTHHDPPLGIEKRKRTAPVAFALDPLGMFIKEFFEYKIKKQEKYHGCLAELKQPVTIVADPRHDTDPQDIDPGNDPDDACRD